MRYLPFKPADQFLRTLRHESAQICYLVARQPFAAYSHTGGARRIQPYRAALPDLPVTHVALIIHAGLDGIADALPLTPPWTSTCIDAEPSNAYPLLPRGLGEAANVAAASDLTGGIFPAGASAPLLRTEAACERMERNRKPPPDRAEALF